MITKNFLIKSKKKIIFYFNDSVFFTYVLNLQLKKVPWMKITSLPVWAIIIAHGTNVFNYFTVVNQLPTYMKYFIIISNRYAFNVYFL